jgi:anti-sigma regulatory factor (Ser/Thr protein kinase)
MRTSPRRRGVDIRLAASAEAPAAARRAVEQAGVPPDLLEDAQLLASELVTNSVRHARVGPGGWIGLRARPTLRGARLEVCDPGPGFAAPPPLPGSDDRFGGRGLPIVDMLADRWGAGRTPGGRWEVWVELDRRSAAASWASLGRR